MKILNQKRLVFGTFAAFVGLSPDDAGGGETVFSFLQAQYRIVHNVPTSILTVSTYN